MKTGIKEQIKAAKDPHAVRQALNALAGYKYASADTRRKCERLATKKLNEFATTKAEHGR